MINKKQKQFKLKLFLLASALLFSVFSLNFIFAQDVNYCCEKTTSGAWCQNAPQSECDSAFLSSPTACESTSYCKPGCCFDSLEGICMESTPQRVCGDSDGTWLDSETCDITPCNPGCCILGDQGAFVSLTRCKQLAGFYGLDADFRTTITDELTCIATAQAADKGACVVDNPLTGVPDCTFTLREECPSAAQAEITNLSYLKTYNKSAPAGFYNNILCSAEELGTICAPTQKTTLVEGKDEVYFVDSCGNIANIYDASKINDKEYWKIVFRKEESCGYGDSNAGSKTCGNCDYFYGSIGKSASLGTGYPDYGDYICYGLDCKDAGKKHGESWCVTDSPTGNGEDTVGSRYFKQICVFNEVITEPCADYRNQKCIEGQFGTYTEAACRANRWQDCVQQVDQDDCENADIRDCMWMPGYYFSSVSGQIEKSNNDTEVGALTPTGLCVPLNPPGYNFWTSAVLTSTSQTLTSSSTTGNFSATTPAFSATTSAFGSGYVDPTTASVTDMCALGNTKAVIKWKKVEKLWPFKSEEWQCDNEECTKYISDPSAETITDADAQKFASDMNEICYRLGDCGGYVNWLGAYTEDGFAAYLDSKRIAGSGGAEIIEAASTTGTTGTTGNVVVNLVKKIAEK